MANQNRTKKPKGLPKRYGNPLRRLKMARCYENGLRRKVRHMIRHNSEDEAKVFAAGHGLLVYWENVAKG